MEEKDNDLNFVSTEELIKELINRHDGLVIVRNMKNKKRDESGRIIYDYDGGLANAIGMMELAKSSWMHNWNQMPELGDD